jgi:hypothetical protein
MPVSIEPSLSFIAAPLGWSMEATTILTRVWGPVYRRFISEVAEHPFVAVDDGRPDNMVSQLWSTSCGERFAEVP